MTPRSTDGAGRQLRVRQGWVSADGDLVLRPHQPFDPPLVVALPSLLYARCHQAGRSAVTMLGDPKDRNREEESLERMHYDDGV